MARRADSALTVVLLAVAIVSAGCGESRSGKHPEIRRRIVTSDTILSGMCETLLPPEQFAVAAILPPGQCPGHYDIKLTDIARVKEADLVISFREMPFMNNAEMDAGKHLLIETNGHNWMAPPRYVDGLNTLAGKLIERFPEQKSEIMVRKERAIREVAQKTVALRDQLQRSRISQMPVLASSMLKELLEWMGLRVVGEYGRPESMSAKEIIELTRRGKEKKAILIVDNLQSGPEAGKGIAEALNVPHVVFSNFPLEHGYAETISENVKAALSAAGTP